MSNVNPDILECYIAARKAAEKSPDPHKKVGCVAMRDMSWGKRGRKEFTSILAVGWNHAKQAPAEFYENRENRRPFIIHAELDLLAKVSPDVEISAIIITLFPCVNCMLALASRNVHTIYYGEVYEKDLPAFRIAEFYDIKCIKL